MDETSPLRVAAALGDLAVRMHGHTDPQATLCTIVTAATTIVPGVSWAGVSLIHGTTVTPTTPTDDVAHALNQLQNDLGEGPAMDAIAQQHTVLIPDLGAETRWPRFITEATTRGVHTMVAFRLFIDRGTLGVLTLYGPEPNSFDDDAVLYGEILAQHAAVAMAGAQAEEQLHRAVASRDVIGQAKGIIMERFGVDAVRAFEMLTQISQADNVKLLTVATQVIDTASDSCRNPAVSVTNDAAHPMSPRACE